MADATINFTIRKTIWFYTLKLFCKLKSKMLINSIKDKYLAQYKVGNGKFYPLVKVKDFFK